MTLILPVFTSTPNLVQIDQELAEICPFCVFSKMADAAILNFQKVTFWSLGDTCIARTYKHTKFGENRSRIDRDTPFCVFSKMAAAAILDLLFVDFGPPTMSQLLGFMLPANGVMMSLNLSEIL